MNVSRKGIFARMNTECGLIGAIASTIIRIVAAIGKSRQIDIIRRSQ